MFLKKIALILIAWPLFSEIASAQVITTMQAMSFGTAVVLDNSVQHEINLDPNGSYVADPEFSFVSPPSEGIYVLTGGTPFALVSAVNITVDQQMNGLGEDFIIDNFNASYPPQINGAGELTVELGARLRTTGSGITYTADTAFNSVMTMDIIY